MDRQEGDSCCAARRAGYSFRPLWIHRRARLGKSVVVACWPARLGGAFADVIGFRVRDRGFRPGTQAGNRQARRRRRSSSRGARCDILMPDGSPSTPTFAPMLRRQMGFTFYLPGDRVLPACADKPILSSSGGYYDHQRRTSIAMLRRWASRWIQPPQGAPGQQNMPTRWRTIMSFRLDEGSRGRRYVMPKPSPSAAHSLFRRSNCAGADAVAEAARAHSSANLRHAQYRGVQPVGELLQLWGRRGGTWGSPPTSAGATTAARAGPASCRRRAARPALSLDSMGNGVQPCSSSSLSSRGTTMWADQPFRAMGIKLSGPTSCG